MKKTSVKLTALVLALILALALTGCGSKSTSLKIAVPNDTTNEARALQLLAAQGLITVRDGAGLTATVNDITDNPHNLQIKEIEAAQHITELPATGRTSVTILGAARGVGGIDSWGTDVEEPYRVSGEGEHRVAFRIVL